MEKVAKELQKFKRDVSGGHRHYKEDLLTFGYTCRIYADDEQAKRIAEERHLIPHPADPQLLTDRYDCRLHLISVDILNYHEENEARERLCPTEELEEEMCDEERYRDLHELASRINDDGIEKRSAEFGYDYDDSQRGNSSSEEEVDDSYQPPEGIKLPVGMNLPETMKQNAVIERTASFVVAQGPQMEIVIKAKQRGNLEQFGFLEFDHPLNAYYKYISKLIREKKYMPKPQSTQQKSKMKSQQLEEEEYQKEQADKKCEEVQKSAESDSDSDNGECYLHPLLMGSGSLAVSSGSQSPLIGPKTREELKTPPESIQLTKSNYELGKADDIYSTLFRNLATVVSSQTKSTKHSDTLTEEAENKGVKELQSERSKDNYAEWYLNFYGEPPERSLQPSIIPPPPNIMPTVNFAAHYVAKYGSRAEKHIACYHEMNLDFMKPSSPYCSYYHSRIRYYQKTQATLLQQRVQQATVNVRKEGNVEDKAEDSKQTDGSNGKSLTEADAHSNNDRQSSSELSALLNAPPPPLSLMNRKIRRRGFHDPPLMGNNDIQIPSTVGLVVPELQIGRVKSSPALLEDMKSEEYNIAGIDEKAKVAAGKSLLDEGSSIPIVKKMGAAPISFSLNPSKADEKIPPMASAAKLGAYDDDDEGVGEHAVFDVPVGVIATIPSPGLAIPPPPVAPVPLSTGQLAMEGSAELQSERKLKARLFMEKILNEKRAAKFRAQNEEQQKRKIETLKKYEEKLSVTVPKAKYEIEETGSDSLPSTSEIDQLIHAKIDKVLSETLKEPEFDKEKKSKRRKRSRRHSSCEEKPSSNGGRKSKRRRKRSSSSDKRHRMSKKSKHRSSNSGRDERKRYSRSRTKR